MNFGNASLINDKVIHRDRSCDSSQLACGSCAKMVSNAKWPPSEAPTSKDDRLANDQSPRMK